jgi:membrane associated rhomboid family serine protease
MQQEQDQKPLLGADNNALVAVLAINLVAYVMLGLLKVIYFLESEPIEKFYNQLFYPFTLQSDWIQHPWSLLSYNWVQDGFWGLFANMIWLSIFSYVLQVRGANKHIFPIYFYSGIIGAIVFILIGSNQPLVGAAVSVTGLVAATMTYAPNYKLLPTMAGGIPLWIFGTVFILLQGYTLLDTSLAVNISIIVGGIMGLVYVVLLKRGKDLGKWMHQLLHLLNNSLSPKN